MAVRHACRLLIFDGYSSHRDSAAVRYLHAYSSTTISRDTTPLRADDIVCGVACRIFNHRYIVDPKLAANADNYPRRVTSGYPSGRPGSGIACIIGAECFWSIPLCVGRTT
jgi:hypothetical protein